MQLNRIKQLSNFELERELELEGAVPSHAFVLDMSPLKYLLDDYKAKLNIEIGGTVVLTTKPSYTEARRQGKSFTASITAGDRIITTRGLVPTLYEINSEADLAGLRTVLNTWGCEPGYVPGDGIWRFDLHGFNDLTAKAVEQLTDNNQIGKAWEREYTVPIESLDRQVSEMVDKLRPVCRLADLMSKAFMFKVHHVEHAKTETRQTLVTVKNLITVNGVDTDYDLDEYAIVVEYQPPRSQYNSYDRNAYLTFGRIDPSDAKAWQSRLEALEDFAGSLLATTAVYPSAKIWMIKHDDLEPVLTNPDSSLKSVERVYPRELILTSDIKQSKEFLELLIADSGPIVQYRDLTTGTVKVDYRPGDWITLESVMEFVQFFIMSRLSTYSHVVLMPRMATDGVGDMVYDTCVDSTKLGMDLRTESQVLLGELRERLNTVSEMRLKEVIATISDSWAPENVVIAKYIGGSQIALSFYNVDYRVLYYNHLITNMEIERLETHADDFKPEPKPVNNRIRKLNFNSRSV